MEKIVLFGASKSGKQALEFYGAENVKCFIDNYCEEKEFCEKEVIKLQTYCDRKMNAKIIICSHKAEIIRKQLQENKIYHFEVFPQLFVDEKVPLSENISHLKWQEVLKNLCDKEGFEILEVGSRNVTGGCFRDLFQKANYTGFDYYDGENVDVVGDAHKLSSYFDKKFDLIFSSAVFEHLAMPWKVAEEMNKLLKVGGYVFIETHYAFGSHERPWHFFQFSEEALKVLFSEMMGIQCIEAGVSNPIDGFFSKEADDYLQGKIVSGLYCHSEFLGKKMRETDDFDWNDISLEDVTGESRYPRSTYVNEKMSSTKA